MADVLEGSEDLTEAEAGHSSNMAVEDSSGDSWANADSASSSSDESPVVERVKDKPCGPTNGPQCAFCILFTKWLKEKIIITRETNSKESGPNSWSEWIRSSNTNQLLEEKHNFIHFMENNEDFKTALSKQWF